MDTKLIGVLSTAKFIKQSLTFDLPSINKNIQLLDSQLSNLKRKIDFNDNTIYQQIKQREKQQKNLQIDASNIQQAIIKLVRSIPLIFNQFLQLLKAYNISQLISIYKKVYQSNGNSSTFHLVLQYLINNGDTFVQLYQGKNIPEDAQKLKYKQYQQWKPYNQWQIEIEGDDQNKEILEFKNTILSQKKTRQQILYNLNEILYFFKGVQYQKISNTTTVTPQLSILTQNFIDEAIKNIQNIIQFIISAKLTSAIQLTTNSKYYQILVNKFNNYNKNIAHMKTQIKQYKQQIQQIQKNRQIMVEKLIYLRKKVITAKLNCQQWLTDFIKRQIKITGQINKIQ